MRYVLIENHLCKKSVDGLRLLIQCLGFDLLFFMAEVHEGIVGAHQAWVKMKWVEAIPIPFKNVNNEKVIKIRKDNLIHRFGIPKIIIADVESSQVIK